MITRYFWAQTSYKLQLICLFSVSRSWQLLRQPTVRVQTQTSPFPAARSCRWRILEGDGRSVCLQGLRWLLGASVRIRSWESLTWYVWGCGRSGELALSAGALHQTCCWELSLLVGLVMVCVGKEHGRGWEEDSTLGKGAVFLPASSISHLLTDFQLTFWDFSYTVYVCVYICASPQLFAVLTMAHAGAYVAGWWFDGSLVQHRADPSCAGLTPLTQSCQFLSVSTCW